MFYLPAAKTMSSTLTKTNIPANNIHSRSVK